MRNRLPIIACLVLALAACQAPPTPEVVTGTFLTDTYAYLGHGDKLKVMDISQPVVATPVGEVSVPAHLLGPVRVADGYAYTTNWDYFGNSVFQVYGLENPVQPQLVGEYAFPEYTFLSDFLVSGRYAYVVAPPGLVVLDVSDPRQPRQVGAVTVGMGLGGRMFKLGDRLYAAIGVCGSRSICLSRFITLDVANPVQPVVLAEYDPQVVFYSLEFITFTADQQATLSVSLQGPDGPQHQIQVWDWKTPTAPTLVRATEAPAPVRLITDQAALATRYDQAVILVLERSAAGPANILRTVATPEGAFLAAAELRGDRAYFIYTRPGNESFAQDNLLVTVDLK